MSRPKPTAEQAEINREKQRAAMRRYYHRYAKHRPYKPVNAQGWELQFIGSGNIKQIYKMLHIV